MKFPVHKHHARFAACLLGSLCMISLSATASSAYPDRKPTRDDLVVTLTSSGESYNVATGAPTLEAVRTVDADEGDGRPLFSPHNDPKPRTQGDLPPVRSSQGSGIGINGVIGSDDRTRVANTTVYPYSAMVQLEVVFDGEGFICSGFMISADTVGTAGHCIHEGATDTQGLELGTVGEFAEQVIAYPGRDGDYLPYGSCLGVELYISGGWGNGSYVAYDYGAIKLDCEVGNVTGTLGYTTRTASNAVLAGYPGDKTPYATLWQDYGDVSKFALGTRYEYAIDTFGGQSGGPVYYSPRDCNGSCAVGIHAYGLAQSNTGTAISTVDGSFDNFSAWRQ
ncbi:hypothetical protein D9V41_14005 [Aeromicrobium phragmitis]|uniref:Serine protease n=1 Tax=Aeromicrobium phragmitis TaxID=2478914 RepID=A0A3L8PHZ7_9ACTN|nr:trypsin-like serine protease [Aeromicrobium phragmitis]RLV54927.1 hypothetical protein D9V41_14005 [Aeromicrobium phragmitis]